jgi:hypothetical protein
MRREAPGPGVATAALLTLLLLLGVVAPLQSASAYDFRLSSLGPRHVVRGYPHYSQLSLELREGSRDYAHVSVAGLPPGTTHDFPDARLHCCGVANGVARLWTPHGSQRLLLQTTPGTPDGTYTVRVTVTSRSLTREVSFPLVVHPAPLSPVRRDVISSPPIPELTRWESQMVNSYSRRCDGTHFPRMGLGWEGDDWYYDGARVRYQIALYTGDRRWRDCGDALNAWYRRQVLVRGLTGWRVFPHGLRMHYERTREAESLDALRATINKTSYGGSGGGVSPALIRETAYMIQSYVNNERAGEPPLLIPSAGPHERFAALDRSVAYGIGHLDQYVDGPDTRAGAAYHQPFMAGLMMEALIEYYEFRRAAGDADPRIPWVVERTANWLWSTAWIPSAEAFYYDSKEKAPAPDLNLLIAPAFAWLWQLTGDPRHQERGDAVFAGGVRHASLHGPKHFNQNYRWSFDYVRWRSPAAASGHAPGSTRVELRGFPS